MKNAGTKLLEIKWGDKVYCDFFAHDLPVALKKALEHYKKLEKDG